MTKNKTPARKHESATGALLCIALAKWAEDNNIKSEMDLMEYNYRMECKDHSAMYALIAP